VLNNYIKRRIELENPNELIGQHFKSYKYSVQHRVHLTYCFAKKKLNDNRNLIRMNVSSNGYMLFGTPSLSQSCHNLNMVSEEQEEDECMPLNNDSTRALWNATSATIATPSQPSSTSNATNRASLKPSVSSYALSSAHSNCFSLFDNKGQSPSYFFANASPSVHSNPNTTTASVAATNSDNSSSSASSTSSSSASSSSSFCSSNCSEGKKLFVGNLPCGTTLAELLKVFKRFGPVNEKLSVVKDQNYAFIHFYSKEDANAALREINDSLFKDRYIRVQYSTSPGYTSSSNQAKSDSLHTPVTLNKSKFNI